MSLQPITLTNKSTKKERELLLRPIYQQVLERQPYNWERQKYLQGIEKDFIKGKLGIRHFLKLLAVSPVYLENFYENSSNVKFIENAFKHFLGRSPHDETEIRACDQILVTQGVKAMVAALVDSDEYRKLFGSFTVPYWQSDRAYDCPNDYLESELLHHEHAGDRGWAIPTLYWHELHLDCTGGVCRPAWHPSSRLRSD
jgi:phycoerythrin-associated linker protein